LKKNAYVLEKLRTFSSGPLSLNLPLVQYFWKSSDICETVTGSLLVYDSTCIELSLGLEFGLVGFMAVWVENNFKFTVNLTFQN